MFQVYLPDVKEAKELFDDKKPPDDENDDKVIDVHKQRIANLQLGTPVEFLAGNQVADEDFVYHYDGYDHYGDLVGFTYLAEEVQGLIQYKPPNKDEECSRGL